MRRLKLPKNPTKARTTKRDGTSSVHRPCAALAQDASVAVVTLRQKPAADAGRTTRSPDSETSGDVIFHHPCRNRSLRWSAAFSWRRHSTRARRRLRREIVLGELQDQIRPCRIRRPPGTMIPPL